MTSLLFLFFFFMFCGIVFFDEKRIMPVFLSVMLGLVLLVLIVDEFFRG